MEPYEALFERIKELMKKEGLTKYKLSMQSGLPHSTVSNIMKGKTKSAGFLSIVNICRGLNISVIEFFQSSSDCNPEILRCNTQDYLSLYSSYIF